MKSLLIKIGFVFFVAIAFFLMTSQKNSKVLEVEKLIIGQSGKACIEMVVTDNTPIFSFKDVRGKTSLQLIGGDIPSIHFFDPASSQEEPAVVMGVIQQVPHLFITGKQNSDAMLLHGGSPTSLLFLDQTGDVQVAVSRMGFYAKPVKGSEEKEEKPPFFSSKEVQQTLKKIERPR